jgi:23S rRNA pseudouridine1911/1915/1917 synthase
MNINIIYEDDDIMVINKPSGLVVHPGSGNYDNTLVNGLLDYTNELSDNNGEERPGIVHRIDKDTSGLLLVAKNNNSHNILSEYFKNHDKIKREYIALICGEFPHETATIDAPIGRDPKDRKRMTVRKDNSKEAITHLKVLKRYKGYTLVSLILETGRTHQIRVHMNYIGYPIYNDPVYNTKKATEFGQFLHSYKMDFIHPITKKEMHFESELPEEFQNFLNTLEEK